MPTDDLGAWDGLLSREEVLEGLPTRRAATLLYAIETRTARLLDRSRNATALYVSEDALAERDHAFVEALAEGAELPIRPTIQDLERHAEEWGPLVPRNPRLQAALAHLLGERYRFTASEVGCIRHVLGLDDAAVGEAHARLYGAPLESVFVPRTGPAERLRWLVARLQTRVDRLSPFWTSYSLTLTETVGATTLALPIALAGIGPLPGVVVLVVLGLANALTLAYFAEAVARSGTVRATDAYLGRMVGDYLGPLGSAVLSVALFILCLLALAAFYVGFGTVLADVSGMPAPLWVGLIFVVGLYYLRRESLNATVTSALVVGGVNIALIVAISLVALGHLDLDNLRHAEIPLVGGRGLDATVLGLVFGVVLAAYFGHTSAGLCGRLVLRRDPSGRQLIRGCVAAHLTTVAMYCLFVVAVNGAVDPQVLAAETGTALEPLAQRTGPAVRVLGTVFAILALGMVTIQFSLAAFNLARERLPSSHRPVDARLRRRGTVRLAGRGRKGPKLALTYLGLDGDRARFRIDLQAGDQLRRLEALAPPRWEVFEGGEVARLLAEGAAASRLGLHVETVHATPGEVQIRLTSSLRILPDAVPDAGLDLSGVLAAGDDESTVAGWLARHGAATADEISTGTGLSQDATRKALDGLAARGTAAAEPQAGDVRHTVRMGARRPRELPDRIWEALRAEGGTAPPPGHVAPVTWKGKLARAALGRRGRFALATAPITVVFAATQAMLTTGTGSFTGLLAVLGILTVVLLAGVFPVLLLASSRRKGEHAVAVLPRWLSHPVVAGGVYTLFLASLVLHGLVIWDELLWRLAALLVAVVAVTLTVVLHARGAFAPRLNLEVWEETDEHGEVRARYAMRIGSDPVAGEIILSEPADSRRMAGPGGDLPPLARIRAIAFRPEIPATGATAAGQLKVWVHTSVAAMDGRTTPGTVVVRTAGQQDSYDLALSGGVILRSLDTAAVEVDIDLGARPPGSAG